MEINISTKGNGVKVVQIIGKLDNSSYGKFQDQISDLINKDCKIIFDMSRCDFVSSAGCRALLVTSRDVEEENGKFAVFGMNDTIIDIMNITGFDNIFEVYNTLSEAIAAILKEDM